MPERHLLDVLKNVHHEIPYTRYFGPPSGADPKLPDAVSRYLFTIFGYASELGATQTARHTQNLIGWHTLRRLNTQHITTEKLEAALRDVINDYTRFELPFFWGSGQAASAVVTPLRKIVIDSAFGQEIVGQHIPWTPAPMEIPNGVEDFAQVDLAWASAAWVRFGRGK